MAKGEASVVVKVVDKATDKLNDINKQIKAAFAPLNRLAGAAGRLAKVTGITALTRGMANLGAEAARTAKAVLSIAAPLGAITSALSVAGMGRVIQQFAEAGSSSAIFARRLDTTVSHLSAMRGAARLAGVEVGAFDSAIGTLSTNLQDAANGRNNELANHMRGIGMDVTDAAGKALKASDVLPEILSRLNNVSDPRQRERLAQQFFGGDAAAMEPMIRQAQRFQQLMEEARKKGSMTDEQAAAATKLSQSFAGVTLSVEGLFNAMTAKLAPVISQINDSIAKWIDRNREVIATKLDEWIKDLVEWFDKLDWVAIEDGFDEFCKTVTKTADAVKDLYEFLTKVHGIAGAMDFTSMTAATRPLSNWIRQQLGLSTSNGGGNAAPARLDGTVQSRAQEEVEYWKSRGYSEHAAVAIAATGVQESGLKPDAQNSQGNYGSNQWDTTRRRNFERVMGRPIEGSTLAQQRIFQEWEFNNTHRRAAAALRAARNSAEATRAMTELYAVPAKPGTPEMEAEIAKRTGIARGIEQNRAAPLPAAPAPAAGVPGRVSVIIDHRNAPANVAMSSRAEGSVTVAHTAPAFVFGAA